VEAADQLVTGDRPAHGELAGAVAHVRHAADARDDPLPEVAAEVQQEVADRVHRVVRTPPDLGVVQLADAVLDPPGTVRQVPSRLAVVRTAAPRGAHSSVSRIRAAIAFESWSALASKARTTRRRRCSGWFWLSFHFPSSRVISTRNPTIILSIVSTCGADASN